MLAHRLKGAGGSYGYPSISALAAEMEHRFSAYDGTCFPSDIAMLERMAEAAESGLAGAPAVAP
jgi:HPt (histidine-containing phosphotransfer) domain-containing protein